MVLTDAQKRASIKYAKANIKRIPLDLRIDDQYPALKAAAEAAGEAINEYIKGAIRQRMEREGLDFELDPEELRQRKAARLAGKEQ